MNPVNTDTFHETLKSTLTGWGFSGHIAEYIADFSLLIIILMASIIIYYITKVIINRILRRLVEKSNSKWDDFLYEEKVFTRLALLLPALFLQVALTPTISEYPEAIRIIGIVLRVYMTAVFLLVVVSFLNTVYRIYGEFEVADSKPIKGYLQVARIIVFIVGGVSIISILVGESPMTLLAGLGAMSAILLLIFKDSILGFVAGVQLSGNKMLMIGDWITMPKYNADGTVIDVSLVTVKVLNFDNSVSFIPAYTLVSDSFQNWRSMAEAGGRRMKRSILIDIGTIRFVDDIILDGLKKRGIQVEHLMVEGEEQTNVGLFRSYLIEYLKTVPNVNPDAYQMVRQLQATEFGLPLEVVAFFNPPDIAPYEHTVAKLFEYVFAVLPEFGLKAFQRPSGMDIASA
jgi:miniconductance mechanosensitive channel